MIIKIRGRNRINYLNYTQCSSTETSISSQKIITISKSNLEYPLTPTKYLYRINLYNVCTSNFLGMKTVEIFYINVIFAFPISTFIFIQKGVNITQVLTEICGKFQHHSTTITKRNATQKLTGSTDQALVYNLTY